MMPGVIFMSVFNRFRSVSEYASAAVFGGVMYGALETLFRGYTHPSMIVTGGICFAGLYAIDKHCRSAMIVRAILGAMLITAAEFVAGCICNLWLGWSVWDYSHLHPNLLGQICLPFSILWAFLTLPAYKLAALLRLAVTGADADQAPAESESEASSPGADASA